MNRKLDSSLIALSTSGLFLVLGLLAGSPVQERGALPAAPAVATVAAEPGEVADAVETEAPKPARRSPRSARRGLAMPYFSFAHGMRRVGG